MLDLKKKAAMLLAAYGKGFVARSLGWTPINNELNAPNSHIS